MEAIVELIFSVFGEFLLQIIFEILFDSGIAVFSKRYRPLNPLIAIPGYLSLGIVAGCISLLIYREPLITDPLMQQANLIITPIFAGLTMMLIGRYKRRKGKRMIKLESFAYGAIFAFGMAGIRYLCWI